MAQDYSYNRRYALLDYIQSLGKVIEVVEAKEPSGVVRRELKILLSLPGLAPDAAAKLRQIARDLDWWLSRPDKLVLELRGLVRASKEQGSRAALAPVLQELRTALELF